MIWLALALRRIHPQFVEIVEANLFNSSELDSDRVFARRRSEDILFQLPEGATALGRNVREVLEERAEAHS